MIIDFWTLSIIIHDSISLIDKVPDVLVLLLFLEIFFKLFEFFSLFLKPFLFLNSPDLFGFYIELPFLSVYLL